MPASRRRSIYLIGESRSLIENSPYLETFKSRGMEVLLLTDPVDEFLASSIPSYKEKHLKAVDRGDVEPDKETDEKRKADAEKYKSLLDVLKGRLPDVKDVRLSTRLKESAAVLVADEGAMSAHLERLLHRMGRGEEIPPSERVLEINPDHPALQAMNKLVEKDAADVRIDTYVGLLYDQR